MTKLLGIGAALVDCLAHVPEEFLDSIEGAKGGMELIDYPLMRKIIDRLPSPPSRAPGGSAANTIMAFARLGGSAGMLAKTGNDETGNFYRRQFKDAGVDITPFKVTNDIPTGSCLSMITPDSQRTMRTFLGASATLGTEEIVAEDFTGYSHLHVEGYLLFNRELLLHVLELARQAGCRISLDLGAPEVVAAASDLLPQMLNDYVDMVFANQDEAPAYGDDSVDTPEKGLHALSQVCALAAVKLGADGVMIKHAGNVIKVPGLRVDAVDTTGAGDLWAAGFLYGLSHHMSLESAAALGARLGAEVVKTTGAVLDDKTWQSVRQDFKLPE